MAVWSIIHVQSAILERNVPSNVKVSALRINRIVFTGCVCSHDGDCFATGESRRQKCCIPKQLDRCAIGRRIDCLIQRGIGLLPDLGYIALCRQRRCHQRQHHAEGHQKG